MVVNKRWQEWSSGNQCVSKSRRHLYMCTKHNVSTVEACGRLGAVGQSNIMMHGAHLVHHQICKEGMSWMPVV
jgi:hypothetical protein